MDAFDPVALRNSRDRRRVSIALCTFLVGIAVLGVFVPPILIVIPVALIGWFLWHAWRTGRNARIAAGSIVFILAAGVVIADLRSRAQSARIETLRATTETNLCAQLSSGDASEKIEQILRESRIPFTYSDVLHGYYASISTGDPDSRIDVTISTTSSKQLLRISVRTRFISL